MTIVKEIEINKLRIRFANGWINNEDNWEESFELFAVGFGIWWFRIIILNLGFGISWEE